MASIKQSSVQNSTTYGFCRDRQQMAAIGNKKGDAQLVLAIASGCSVKQAAKLAGISQRTAHRRLQSTEFVLRIAVARDELFKRAVGVLASAATEAVQTLRSLLDSESLTVQLGAARAILEHGPKLREHCELECRITAMETFHNATQ
jgi:molybdenum-dependent DNA-binding transcriptional regulator ModE